jgi:16S rRNA A1518/A1519 N6-dimethyltransferase RsmA/KsgA/DIM1 with predicted DNA glycosylase/AP lyase activity
MLLASGAQGVRSSEGQALPDEDGLLASFSQRRKTLRNNLKGIIDAAQLQTLGIDPGARAETLELIQFIEITNAIEADNSVTGSS